MAELPSAILVWCEAMLRCYSVSAGVFKLLNYYQKKNERRRRKKKAIGISRIISISTPFTSTKRQDHHPTVPSFTNYGQLSLTRRHSRLSFDMNIMYDQKQNDPNGPNLTTEHGIKQGVFFVFHRSICIFFFFVVFFVCFFSVGFHKSAVSQQHHTRCCFWTVKTLT